MVNQLHIYLLKQEKMLFFGNKTFDQRFGANIKTHFFANFFANLLICYVFQLFSTKIAKNDYFDQCLGCTAPKRWSKYITII